MPTLTERITEGRGRLDERRKNLHEIFEQAGPEMDMDKVTVIEGDSTAKVAKIREINDELDAIAKELEPLEEDMKSLTAAKARGDEFAIVDNPMIHPKQKQGGSGPAQQDAKSFGELFTESAAYKRKGQSGVIDVSLKALFESATGWIPETTRGPRFVDLATRPIQITDVIPQTTTTQQSVVYMEETTFTNAAAEVAEAGTKPEAALALTEKTSPVRKIAVWLPVTDEQLEDVPQVQAYLNNRLPFMVRQRLDSQILVGNGTAPNLRGILNVVGIQTQAKGTDPTPDAIYKALVKVRVTGRAIPNAVVAHDNDWQDVRLLRTADGIYIWGSPSEVGQQRIWGLPVVTTDAITEGTGLVGDFQNFSELAVRKGMEVKTSDSHSDFFITNKQAIRAEMRAALVIYRPTAFATVTGI